jgi:hypothetical protein
MVFAAALHKMGWELAPRADQYGCLGGTSTSTGTMLKIPQFFGQLLNIRNIWSSDKIRVSESKFNISQD